MSAEHLVAREDITLREVVKLFVPQRFHLITLVDGQMNYLGQVTEVQVINALFNHGMEYGLGALINREK
ncbi:hypothetical protein N752_28290 [Desulforamulus aquiferis]|nr:CBS domain-containing protein [Desulforamulus aquiferis]RYD01758.1 hypothetical protein N752_28290 [Desulforamulus aquiferis]